MPLPYWELPSLECVPLPTWPRGGIRPIGVLCARWLHPQSRRLDEMGAVVPEGTGYASGTVVEGASPSSSRIAEGLRRLAQIAGGPGGEVSRLAFTPAEREAHALVADF